MMSSDMLILVVLSEREKYNTLIEAVPNDLLSPELMWVLKWFKPFFKMYPTHPVVRPDLLLQLIKSRAKLDEDKLTIVEHILEGLGKPVDEELAEAAAQQLNDRKLASQASQLIMDYQNGSEVDLAYELQSISTKAFETSVANSDRGFISGKDADKVLKNLSDEGGLRPTFLSSLDSFLRPILPGDTVLIAASPGAGKTSFVANLVTSLAPQIDELFGDRPVLWLNNEGSGDKILSRVFSSALNATFDEVAELHNQGKLYEAYGNAVRGLNRILIKDSHGYSMANVTRMVQAVRPCVVVFDMMAHFSIGSSDLAAHERVERLWQAARELAVKYNFVAIGTSQFSKEGTESLYPSMKDLKDSKIGVQGAIETMIFMGKKEENQSKERYFSCPKVKRARVDVSELQFAAHFDTDRCRFY